MVGLAPDIWKKLSEKPLYLDQTDTLIEFNREEVESFYSPLAEMLLRKGQKKSRVLVCIAGPPGSGKTIFATLLVSVINAIEGHGFSVYVGLDGWHYPNAYLETHTTVIGGETIPLRKIKGAPESFDSGAAFFCLHRIRQGGMVSFPLYSRELHDPVPDKGTVQPYHQIIIVEGNYLLLDEDPWKQFFPLFDIRIFLDVETRCLLDGLRERHQRGGKSSDFIEQHIRSVDLPNILRVKPGINKAQLIVHKADNRRIVSVEGLE
jgi:pantothenate kinase